MAIKIKKSLLKKLVKECLVEVLNEGILARGKPMNESVVLVDDENDTLEESNMNVRGSNPSGYKFGPAQIKSNPTSRPTSQASQTASKITSDPIMQSIFADTASTTLQDQLSAEKNGGQSHAPVDRAEAIVRQSNPMELFEGASDKWAQLAFSDSVKKQ